MGRKMNTMEVAKIKDEIIYYDLNDVLDILDTAKKGYYSIIFPDGEAWFNVKLRKSTCDKFLKIKERRGQK
mgnify:CR=1 FL=1